MDANTFFIVKGIFAAAAVALLIYHMNDEWHVVEGWGRKLRYITLLGLAANISYASVEQQAQNLVVERRHVIALVLAVLLVVTTVVSIRESRHPQEL